MWGEVAATAHDDDENGKKTLSPYNTLEKQLQAWLHQLPVLGFNSGKYDPNTIKRFFVPLLIHNSDTECRNTTSTRITQWFVSLVKRLVEVSLQVQQCRGYAIGEHYALPVEVGESCSLLDVCHHGRIVHPETAVGPAATAPIRQHGEEGFFVDGVLTLAESLRAALVSRA